MIYSKEQIKKFNEYEKLQKKDRITKQKIDISQKVFDAYVNNRKRTDSEEEYYNYVKYRSYMSRLNSEEEKEKEDEKEDEKEIEETVEAYANEITNGYQEYCDNPNKKELFKPCKEKDCNYHSAKDFFKWIFSKLGPDNFLIHPFLTEQERNDLENWKKIVDEHDFIDYERGTVDWRNQMIKLLCASNSIKLLGKVGF